MAAVKHAGGRVLCRGAERGARPVRQAWPLQYRSTELFERYQRSERALVGALAEMYVQGVSTRKVKAITEELCGHSFSASSISAINQRLDDGLAQFADRRLVEAFPYLILDARYERVREAGVIASQAVLIAIGSRGWRARPPALGAGRPSRCRSRSAAPAPVKADCRGIGRLGRGHRAPTLAQIRARPG